MTKKNSLTRTLMAACSVFALTAVMYGCVHSGDDPPAMEQPDPDIEARALAAAQDAATAAWQGARDALAGIAGDGSANPAAYQRAMNALADAAAANTAAQAATTSADAREAADDAEAALATVTAQVAMVVAARDSDAIGAAQMVAAAAADAAKVAYDAAVAALAAVESIQDIDQASYDKAAAQVAEAKTAYDTAMAASTAAGDATLLADAEAQRDAAQAAMTLATLANTAAMKYAGMVQTAEDTALSSLKNSAQSIHDAAKMAYDAAAARVAALAAVNDDGNVPKDDNVEDYVRAKDALARAKTALDAAAAANDMAQAAETSSAGAPHHSDVEDAADGVTPEVADANMYAMLVETAYNAAQAQRNTDEENRLAEEQRVMDVAAARDNAMQSYTDADAAATKAETAADEAQATAPDSPRAIAARTAANAARTAANNAKDALDAITDEMTKAEADAKASDAATAANTANTQYMAAKEQNDAIQTAHQIAVEQQRAADVTAATGAADEAAKAARAAATAARKAAVDAAAASAAAGEALNKANAARTDAENTEKYGGMAGAAATAADEAATAAENAATAAEQAVAGIDPDGSAEAAQTAQSTAKGEQKKAEDQRDIATTAYDSDDEDAPGAKQLAALAEEAADTHVLGLLIAANAPFGVKDDPGTTDTNERDEAVTAMTTAIADAAGAGDGDADNDSSTGSGGSTASATAAWAANTPANPDATPPTEEVVVPLTITVTRTSGTDLVWRTEAAEEDDANTAEVDETIVTATKIDGVPGFPQGYSISDRGTHAIVFTDKDQDDAPVEAADAVTFREVINEDMDDAAEVTKLGTKSGNTYTGAEWTPGTEAPLTGTLTCPANTACSITLDADGGVSAIDGYVFTGRREAKAAVTAMNADAQAAANDYLVFGVWLDGDDSVGNDGTGVPQVAAFANGGRDFATPVALYGTAKYTGAATGVYTEGTSVDYFQGRASLTANFGDTPDEGVTDTAEGTVTGMIDQIVAGGVSMSDVISLNTDGTPADGNITATGGFAGNARMGAPKVEGDVVTYTYTGTWGGQFHGAPAATTPTDLTSTTTPPSAAGTFGVTGSTGEGEDAVTRSYVGAFGAHKQ